MLALDVNLQQSRCGEELLTLVTLMELQICECERKEVAEKTKDEEQGWVGRGPTFHIASADC